MRKIACLTLDIEADFLDPTGRIRLLEDEALLNRYVSIINSRRVKVTGFLVTSLLPKNGAAYRRLSTQIPIEFAVHSHAHDMHNPCSPADIELAARTFHDFFGRAPIGYRAPVGQITRAGMETLMDLGFRYDSSIYPSVRPGKAWGYNNLHLPVEPFRVRSAARSILEVPFASLSTIRLNFSLSYVKLFGWPVYSLLLKLFPSAGSGRGAHPSARPLLPPAQGSGDRPREASAPPQCALGLRAPGEDARSPDRPRLRIRVSQHPV